MDIYGYNMDMNIQKKHRTLSIFDQIKILRKEIETYKPFDGDLLRTIQEKLRIEWTYNSNAIEGNTLTLGETAFFLREGLTSEGKPLKDFLEAKNHAEAIDALDDVVQKKQKITEHFIKSLHSVLLKDIHYIYVKGAGGKLIQKQINVGKYKVRPNHVLTISGKVHHYTEPEQVQIEMEKLLEWYYSKKVQTLSAIERASLFHYRFVNIHPFDDGNGRISRLLMNLILMQEGYPPCIIRNEKRRRYLSELENANITEKTDSFVLFVAQELLETLTMFFLILNGTEKADFIQPEILNAQQRKSLILDVLEDQELSIGQIHDNLPQIKHPTLKKDLQDLVKSGEIQRKGIGKGVTYLFDDGVKLEKVGKIKVDKKTQKR